MNNSLQDAAIKYIEEDAKTAFKKLVEEWENRLKRTLAVEEYAALCGAYVIGHILGCEGLSSD